MRRPFTLLEDLCRHALSIGADSVEMEFEGRQLRVNARSGNTGVTFASFPSSGVGARELLENLYRAQKKPLRTVLENQVCLLKVKVTKTFGEEAFTIKTHGLAPAESDLQNYFGVSPPSVHNMIKTLERNSLIERTAGRARSIRLRVQPEYLPKLI